MQVAPHTLVFSDIHLTTVVERDARWPLWMRYKQRDLFPDEAIAAMLRRLRHEVAGPIELVLDGDIFDFDAATTLPTDPPFPVSWIERLRGLAPTEAKSTWKLARILDDHPVFVEAVRALVAEGHKVVFVVGNHDLELLWPEAQQLLIDRLSVPGGGAVVVCEWFYVSNGDTLIEHGHQYDAYCLCHDPISPVIRLPPTGEARLRLPFGDHAARFMLNGMGLINPYVSAGYLQPFWQWVLFFYRHVARTQPLLAWTWIWTAFATFAASLRDALLPTEKDILGLDARVEAIAAKAGSTPRVVRGLDALKTHPAIFLPWKVARELWLDRLVLAGLLVLGSFQLVATVSAIFGVSLWWWLVVLVLVLVPFVFYAQRVASDVGNLDQQLRRRLPILRALVGVERIVLGHTHEARHVRMDGVEVLNAGTWSASFRDLACTEPVGQRCVVRVRPQASGVRTASLEAWTAEGFEPVPMGVVDTPGKLLSTGMSWWDADLPIRVRAEPEGRESTR